MANTLTIPRLLWLGACAIVVIWWMAVYGLHEGAPDTLMGEAMIYVVIAMTLLSFPIGLAWTVLLAIAARVLHEAGVAVQSPLWVNLLLYWVTAVVLGYVQWFVVIPRIRAKRAARAQ